MRPSLNIPCDGDSIYRQWLFADEALLLDSAQLVWPREVDHIHWADRLPAEEEGVGNLALGHADASPPYLLEEDIDVLVGDSKRDLGREEEDKKQLVADTVNPGGKERLATSFF